MRTLTLKKETVTELTTTELGSVAGAAATLTLCLVNTTGGSEVDACLTWRCTR